MPEVKANIRSPFYKRYQQADLEKVVLKVYVYSGAKDTDKGSPVITIEKKPIGSNDYVIFELSEILKEYLEPNITTPLNSNKTYIKWLQLEATLT